MDRRYFFKASSATTIGCVTFGRSFDIPDYGVIFLAYEELEQL